MKTTRRNFLKMAGAAVVALLAPKSIQIENVAQASEVTIETENFYEYLDGVVDAVEWRSSDHLEWQLEGESADIKKWNEFGIYVTHDKGKTWECVGEIP